MDVRVGPQRRLSAKELMFWNCGAGEDSSESLELQGDQTSEFYRKSILNIHWKDWCWSWNSNTLASWCEELTHWKRLWCWERLKAGGEGDDRGWDGWMASTFLPGSKHFFISWLQSLSAVILESQKIKSVTVSTVSPSICYEVMGPDAMILVFWMLSFKPPFSLSSFTFIKRIFSSSLSAIRLVSSAYLGHNKGQKWYGPNRSRRY